MNESTAGSPAPAAPAPTDRTPTEPARATPRSGRSGMALNIALGLAVAVAIGGVAFAAGRLTAPAAAFPGPGGFGGGGGGLPDGGTVPSFVPGQGGFGPGGGFNGGFAGAGGLTIEGTVESVDTDSMTIRTSSGETVEVALDSDTTYHSQTSASAGDIESGGSVIVRLNLQRGAGANPGTTASDVTVVP